MFETETVGPCLVWKLKWGGGHGPPAPPSGYAPKIIIWDIRQYLYCNYFLPADDVIN